MTRTKLRARLLSSFVTAWALFCAVALLVAFARAGSEYYLH